MLEAFRKEFEFERDNYEEVRALQLTCQVTEKKNFLSVKGFDYQETSDGIYLTLSKQVDDKLLEISFKSKQANEEVDDESPINDDHEDYINEGGYTDFTM